MRWVPIAIVAVAACSEFSSSTTAESDGGSSDGGATDAGSVQDGGVDATSDAAAGLCDTDAWICDDFDHPPPTWPIPPWSLKRTTGTGVLELVDAGLSSPNAARFVLPPDGANPMDAVLIGAYVGPSRGMTCDFHLYLEEGGDLEPFRVTTFSGGTQEYMGQIILGGGVTHFVENQMISELIDPLAPDAWYAIHFDVSWGQPAHLSLNGGAQNAGVAAAAAKAPTSIQVQLGASRGYGYPYTSQALIDDVRCTIALP